MLEATDDEDFSRTTLTGYWCNSDAKTPVGMPEDGAGLRDCLQAAMTDLDGQPDLVGICPHASGTLLHGKAEIAALRSVIKTDEKVSLHPLKPFTGHTVGASGVLDLAVLALFMKEGRLPSNIDGNTSPCEPFTMMPRPLLDTGSTVLKIAVGMGGHNSIISLRSPTLS